MTTILHNEAKKIELRCLFTHCAVHFFESSLTRNTHLDTIITETWNWLECFLNLLSKSWNGYDIEQIENKVELDNQSRPAFPRKAFQFRAFLN